MQDYHCVLELKRHCSVNRVGVSEANCSLFISSDTISSCLVKREPVIQNSGATLAVKAGFKLHFPWLLWRLWEVIMKRGFRSSAVTPVGITIVVCAVIIRELLAHDQTFFFVCVFGPQ